MADKQYKRKTAEHAARYPQDDPLSELARIVGYDPRVGGGRIVARADPELDLEAELLRELHGSREEGGEPHEPSIERLDAVSPGRDAAQSWHAPVKTEPSAMADDDLDDALSHDIGISLEEELLGGFEEDGEAPPRPISPGSAANWGGALDERPGHPTDRVGPIAETAAPAAATVRDEPQVGEPAQLRIDDDAGPAGFVFPSADQMEEDESFAADAWWQGGPEAAVSSTAHSVEPIPAAGREEYGHSGEIEAPGQRAEATAFVQDDEGTVAEEVDDSLQDRDAEAPLGDEGPDAIGSEEISDGATMEPVGRWTGNFHDDAETAAGANGSTERAAGPELDENAANGELDDGDGVAETAYAELHSDRLAAAEDVVGDEGDSDLDGWLRSAMEDVDLAEVEPDKQSDAGNVVHLYGAAPGQGGARPGEDATNPDAEPGADEDETNRALAAKAHQIVLSDRSGTRPEFAPRGDAGGTLPHPVSQQGNSLRPESAAPSAADDAAASQTEDGDLPFDPAAIVEHDEVVDPTFDLNIPKLPGEGEEEPVAAAPIDDFDLDSDLADLLTASAADTDGDKAAPRQTTGSAPTAPDLAATELSRTQSVAATGHFEDVTAASIDFDELERAMDADLDAVYSGPSQTERRIPAEVIVGSAANRAAGGPRWQTLGAGVAALVVAGAVVFVGWHFVGGSGDSAVNGGPRIIAADKGPVKEKPVNPGGKAVPNQNKIVYDKVDGSKSNAPQQKTLVTTTEAPVDVVQQNLQAELPSDPSAASGEPDGIPPSQNSATANESGSGAGYDKSQARLTPKVQPASPASATPAGLVPRYVQTMTVTPDGKLVPTNPPAQASAGSASSAPASNTTAMAPATESAPTPQATAPEAAAAPANAAIANAPVPVARPAAPAVQTAAASPAQPAAPAKQTSSPANPVQQPASAQPAATLAAAPKPGDYLIQIASQPTEAGAKASYQNLSRRYSSVIGGKAYDIQKATIQGKGVYYRVRIAAGSRQDAIKLCESYRSAGGSCFVTR